MLRPNEACTTLGKQRFSKLGVLYWWSQVGNEERQGIASQISRTMKLLKIRGSLRCHRHWAVAYCGPNFLVLRSAIAGTTLCSHSRLVISHPLGLACLNLLSARICLHSTLAANTRNNLLFHFVVLFVHSVLGSWLTCRFLFYSSISLNA